MEFYRQWLQKLGKFFALWIIDLIVKTYYLSPVRFHFSLFHSSVQWNYQFRFEIWSSAKRNNNKLEKSNLSFIGITGTGIFFTRHNRDFYIVISFFLSRKNLLSANGSSGRSITNVKKLAMSPLAAFNVTVKQRFTEVVHAIWFQRTDGERRDFPCIATAFFLISSGSP